MQHGEQQEHDAAEEDRAAGAASKDVSAMIRLARSIA
jgi:hypothetical protein